MTVNIEVLVPTIDAIKNQPRLVYPPCDAERTSKLWNEMPGDFRACGYTSRYRLEGVNLCARHAATFALAYLLRESQQ